MMTGRIQPVKNKTWQVWVVWAFILLVALFLRTTGLFRGLKDYSIAHPDSPKQVMSFHNYLNGRYIWYDGSLFIDGYPLFLNHVDEWITRPLYLATEYAARHLHAEHERVPTVVSPYQDYYPNSIWLYYWTRVLRVMYSMVVLLGSYFLARALTIKRPFAWLVALLMAISPIQLVLSHAASGDIGVDMFGVFLFLVFAVYARSDRVWLLIPAGLFGGFTFASKYQGILLSALVFFYLLLRLIDNWRAIKKLFLHGLLYGVSLLTGIVVATPQFFINEKRTRLLILENIEFIKNYKVPPDILAKPALEKALLGFQKNFLPMCEGIGIWLLLTALAGLILAGIYYKNNRRTNNRFNGLSCLRFCLFFLPFFCLLFSLLTKYNVQPFHFAYLQVPFVMAAVYALEHLWAKKQKLLRVTCLLLTALLIISPWMRTLHEIYFWQRQDSEEVLKALTEELIDLPASGEEGYDLIKTLDTEADNLAVFRNRRRELYLQNGIFWNRIHEAPVPCIPFPSPAYWIYNNGPIYPRNDRMFVIAKDSTVEKGILFQNKPASLQLGLRTGLWPSDITVKSGKWTSSYRLPPNTQQIISLPLNALKEQIANASNHFDVWQLPLTIKTSKGLAVATVLQGSREEKLYRLFGGQQDAPPVFLQADVSNRTEVAMQVNRTLYHQQPDNTWKDLHDTEILPLLNFTPLAAGIYKVTVDLIANQPDTVLELSGSMFFSGNNWSNSAWKLSKTVEKGAHTLMFTFEKTFIPYQYHLALRCLRGSCTILKWRVQPDTESMLNDIGNWINSGKKPTWSFICPEHIKPAKPTVPSGITFDNAFELIQATIPDQRGDLGSIDLTFSMKLNKAYRNLQEAVVFIHFVDEASQMKAAIGFPAYMALDSETFALPISCPLDTSLKGTYKLMMGMYSSRTGKRLSVQTPPNCELEIKRKKLQIGMTTLN